MNNENVYECMNIFVEMIWAWLREENKVLLSAFVH